MHMVWDGKTWRSLLDQESLILPSSKIFAVVNVCQYRVALGSRGKKSTKMGFPFYQESNATFQVTLTFSVH